MILKMLSGNLQLKVYLNMSVARGLILVLGKYEMNTFIKERNVRCKKKYNSIIFFRVELTMA